MLKDEIKAIIGNRRKFLLLRIVDVDVTTARKLCHIQQGTYNSWLHDPVFVSLYRRRDEFSAEYKPEAIRLLRRDNQLSAVMLEEKILAKMKEEVETGDYVLLKTNLAKEVYTKLINDLDYQPKSVSLTWGEKLKQIYSPDEPKQLEEGKIEEVIDAEVIETEDSEQAESPESTDVQENVQEPLPTEKKV